MEVWDSKDDRRRNYDRRKKDRKEDDNGRFADEIDTQHHGDGESQGHHGRGVEGEDVSVYGVFEDLEPSHEHTDEDAEWNGNQDRRLISGSFRRLRRSSGR